MNQSGTNCTRTHAHTQAKIHVWQILAYGFGTTGSSAREDSLFLEYRETDHCVSVAKTIPAHTKQSTEV